MRVLRKATKRLGLALLGIGALAIIVRQWLVKALLVAAIQSEYDARVTVGGWWLNGHSAGLTRLDFYEGQSKSSPIWASVGRLRTDLSIGALCRGEFRPKRVDVQSPRLALRIDRHGNLLTRPPFRSGKTGGSKDLPEVVVDDAEVALRQEGHGEFLVPGVGLRFSPAADGSARLSGSASGARLGSWTLTGQLEPGLESGEVVLAGEDVRSSPTLVHEVPFVPSEVWSHVLPTGPLDVRLTFTLAKPPAQALQLRTEIELAHTFVDMPSSGLRLREAEGKVTIEDGIVRLDKVRGVSFGGDVSASGTIDFHHQAARLDLNLGLGHIDATQTPKAWGLSVVGLAGRMTGNAHLRMALGEGLTDLTGTTGEAVVEHASVYGIPVKSLRLVMAPETNANAAPPAKGAHDTSAAALLPTTSRKQLTLPDEIKTIFELERVDAAEVTTRICALGARLPVALTGRLSMQAEITVPLKALGEVAGYSFQGHAQLEKATVDRVPIEQLSARVALAHGVLDVTEIEGQATGATEEQPGNFRGRFHAEINPPGKVAAAFEGKRIPLGPIAAPFIPESDRPNGWLTLEADARGRMNAPGDPAAWQVQGKAQVEQLRCRGASIDRVSASFGVDDGALAVKDLLAEVAGQALRASGKLELHAPYTFSASTQAAEWSLHELLALALGAKAPRRLTGSLQAEAEASGTLQPLDLHAQGVGRLDRLQERGALIGSVPFRWATNDHMIVCAVDDARVFGGRADAQVSLPARGDGDVKGNVALAGIDTAALSALLGGPKLAGRADGKATFVVPSKREELQAEVRLAAPQLVIEGVPAESLRVRLTAHNDAVRYELLADTLGGTLRFQGNLPFSNEGPAADVADAELHAADLSLAQLDRALAVGGPLAHLDGHVRLDAKIRAALDPASRIALRGTATITGLRLGAHTLLGDMRGTMVYGPTGWRLDPLDGELLGGTVEGAIWGQPRTSAPAKLGFELHVDRASLAPAVAGIPSLAKHLTGFGTLRLAGRYDEGLRAQAELRVGHAHFFGLPLNEFRAPAEIVWLPRSNIEAGTGAIHVRHWNGRFAGGSVRGHATLRLGAERGFHTETHLTAIDLEDFTRMASDTRRPASGKISGRLVLNGTDPLQPKHYHGRIELDLADASLFELPVFREIDKFLGSARGGVFDDGSFSATIARGMILVDQLTLAGRAVQVHATGTIGFDMQLNLIVLVNTSQIIGETGQTLLGMIPGLREVIGRGEQATVRMANYLSARLLKLRVSGSLRSPIVTLDPGIPVGESATGFFAKVLKVPVSLGR